MNTCRQCGYACDVEESGWGWCYGCMRAARWGRKRRAVMRRRRVLPFRGRGPVSGVGLGATAHQLDAELLVLPVDAGGGLEAKIEGRRGKPGVGGLQLQGLGESSGRGRDDGQRLNEGGSRMAKRVHLKGRSARIKVAKVLKGGMLAGKPAPKAAKRPGSRLVKCVCSSGCGYTARITQKWIDRGHLGCPCGGEVKPEDADTEDTETLTLPYSKVPKVVRANGTRKRDVKKPVDNS